MSFNYNNSIASSSVRSEIDHPLGMGKSSSVKQSQQSSIPNQHSAIWGSGINSLPGDSSHQPISKGANFMSQGISGHVSTEPTLDHAGMISKGYSKAGTDVYEENEAEKFERVNAIWKGCNDEEGQKSVEGAFREFSGHGSDVHNVQNIQEKFDPFAVWNGLSKEKQTENIEQYEKAKQELKNFAEKVAETDVCDLDILSYELNDLMAKGIDNFAEVMSPHRCYFYLQVGSLYCRTKNTVKAQEYLNKTESALSLAGKNENNGECYRLLYLVKALTEVESENIENPKQIKFFLRKFWDFPTRYLTKTVDYYDFYALILARYYLKIRKDVRAQKSYADALVLRKMANKEAQNSDFEYLGWNEIERYLRQSKFLKKNK